VELSIIITCHREIDLLIQCLVAVRQTTQNIDKEIIVVLSESQEEILEKLKNEFPEVNFLSFKENLYFVKAANQGLKRAKGEYILLINDDVVVSEGSISCLINFLKTQPGVGLVGPKVLYPDKTFQQTFFRFYTLFTIICRRTVL